MTPRPDLPNADPDLALPDSAFSIQHSEFSIPSVSVAGVELHSGDRVRLHPRPAHRGHRTDIFDLALDGKTAVIAAIEQDYENRIYLAVAVEDDPGQDFGHAGKIAHRFFFRPDEVEPLPPAEPDTENPRLETGNSPLETPSILVAGIGNIFLGDDAFGVELAARLGRRNLPAGVRVVDFGIRSLDLAYALSEPWSAAVLLDATPRGGVPGTLYVLEPDPVGPTDPPPAPDAHTMNPLQVLGLVAHLGGRPPRLFILGCEPTPLAADDFAPGLSPAVAAALGPAVALFDSLIARLAPNAVTTSPDVDSKWRPTHA